MKYNDKIYCFDMETTTTEGIVSMYLSSFRSVPFSCFKSGKETILKNISAPTFCRTSEEVNNYFNTLNRKSGKRKTIVFIHNLAYEFDYLVKNIPFVRDNFDNDKALFIKPRIPLFIQINNIELRCSYKLLNKSLSLLGQMFDYPKLEIDYSKKYYFFSCLPKQEYEYNARDTELTLLSILSECKHWDWIKTIDNLPLTSTGFTRKNNKSINSRRYYDDCVKYCLYQKELSKDDIEFLEQCYFGGYNHANAFFAFQAIEKPVISVDITSSYPDSMLHRYYPHFFKEYKGKYPLLFFNKMVRQNNGTVLEKVKNYKQPFEYSFLCEITLKDVKAKVLKGKNLILPISFNKCTDTGKTVLDNGRIYTCEQLTICCNEVDYWVFTQFYNFEVFEVKRLLYTNYHAPLPEYMLNSVRTYATEKSELKKVKDENELNARLYAKSKEKLNAQYGINVQKLLPLDLKYQVEEDCFSEKRAEKIEAKVLTRDFIDGVYITSYSRLNLFCYGLLLLEKVDNTFLLYEDTDSYKILGDVEKIKQFNNWYNAFIEKVNHNSQDFNIGYFDFETVYDAFCTCGCKKYIYLKNGEIHATVAGVNKKAYSKALTELYKKLDNDFDFLCQVAFSPNTLLDYSIVQKMVSKYHNEEYCMEFTDENGYTGVIQGRNMVELCESGYILDDTEKGSIYDFISHCEDLQGNLFSITPTFLYYKDGEIKWRFIDDWTKVVKVYKTDSMNLYDNLKG